MMDPLGESCCPLTLDEAISLLAEKMKVISKLTSDLENEKEQHSGELQKLQDLINDKDGIIEKKDNELEKRPTQKIVNDLREKLKILEVEISEKTSLLEAAEKTITELIKKTEKPENKWFKGIFSMSAQETVTSSEVSKGSSSYIPEELETSLETLSPRLIFCRKENRFRYHLEELLSASAEVLGEGTFGIVYKAVLDSGVTMAVKRLKDVNVSENIFRKNVARITKLEYSNLLPLAACYYSKDEKYLVSDYMATGSLSAILHGSKGSGKVNLNWKTRAKIMLLVSRSISYIHLVDPTLCHGNIISSNVLLSPTYEVLLSDSGLSSIATPQVPNKTNVNSDMSADVYSFGMLMIEILTGKRLPETTMNEDGVDLVNWLIELERVGEVIDVEMADQMAEDDMMQLISLALHCTAPVNRPSMAKVVVILEELLKIDDRK